MDAHLVSLAKHRLGALVQLMNQIRSQWTSVLTQIAIALFLVAIIFIGVVLLNPAFADNHGGPRVALENDHVRVTEWIASPKSPIHVGELSPGVLINLRRARLMKNADNGEKSVADYLPGDVTWVKKFADHQWESLIGMANVFIVEIRSAEIGTNPETKVLGDRDSVIVDPQHHRPVPANAHVRVIDGMASSGAISDRHTHPPSVLVSLRKSRFRVTSRGITSIYDFEPHQVTWINAFEHEWEVVAGDARMVVIEEKSAHSY